MRETAKPKEGQSEPSRRQEELFKAVRRGNEAKTRQLIAAGADPLALTEEGTLLITLAGSGRDSVGVAEALLEAGCPMEALDKGGRSALVWAMSTGSFKMAAALIGRGARMEGRDEKEKTLLHLACSGDKKGGAELARALIKAGADVNARDRRGFTPLHYAAESGDGACCRELIAAGADLEARTINGNTPLHKAAEKSEAEAVAILLAAGACPAAMNLKETTPLERHRAYADSPAVKSQSKKIVAATLGSAETREELSLFIPPLAPSAKKAPKGL